MRRIILFVIAVSVSGPVLACGPGMTGGGRQTKQHRQRQHHDTDWMGRGERLLQSADAENRHHQQQARHRAQQEQATEFLHQDNRGELLLESIDGGHGKYSKWSPAETRRRMENRAGHLLMKYKRGTLTNGEATELQMLIHSLSQ